LFLIIEIVARSSMGMHGQVCTTERRKEGVMNKKWDWEIYLSTGAHYVFPSL
jgi:hypothetical protein